MSAFPLTRRAALASLGALCLPAVAEIPAALAQPGLRIRAIKVDVSPIRASMGDPTAAWVEEALPGALAQSLAPYMAPGDRNGATLVARIDYLYLGPSSGGRRLRRLSANARHDQRNARAERPARRCRQRAAAGDLHLFPDGGRSDAGRAGLARPRDGPCAGVCGMGAEGAGPLEQIASGSAQIVAAIVDRGGRGPKGVRKDARLPTGYGPRLQARRMAPKGVR